MWTYTGSALPGAHRPQQLVNPSLGVTGGRYCRSPLHRGQAYVIWAFGPGFDSRQVHQSERWPSGLRRLP